MNQRTKRAVGRILGLAVAVATGLVALVATTARAEAASVRCNVLCIWATNSEPGTDPGLEGIEELKKPPFAGYKGYKKLADLSIDLEEGKPGELKIADEYKLILTYKGGPPPKISLHVLVPPKKLDANLAVSPGKRFFLAGFAHKDGILILGITCSPLPPPAPKPASKP